jgi:hypothetical protein
MQDRIRIANVGFEIARDTTGGAGQQGLGVQQHERVVIDVDDP